MTWMLNFRNSYQQKEVLRLACFFAILCISVSMMGYLLSMTAKTEHLVALESKENLKNSFSEIGKVAELLQHLNSSASRMARALSSKINATQLTFPEIKTKVAKKLFFALSIVPKLSQISFIGLDGLLFSYYRDYNRLLGVYSNVSHSSLWYTNSVNPNTGKLNGDSKLLTANSSLLASNNTFGYSSISPTWHNRQQNLLVISSPIEGTGAISLGFPLDVVVEHFDILDFGSGYFFLGTVDGHVIIPTKAQDTMINVYDGVVKVDVGSKVRNELVCGASSNDLDTLRGTEIGGYKFFCSTLDIAGIPSVYVLQYPIEGFAVIVQRNGKVSTVLLVLLLILIIGSYCFFMFSTIRAMKRQMFLCSALIKQLEATQQAERKSMNKTKAYASINHDIRGSLAAITSYIELCQVSAKRNPELAANLTQMNKCTKDLLNLLNSILDTSKVEAGKVSLELEDFNLAQLLEEVVEMYYPSGMKKGVDIVLDPCDGSVLKLPLIKGDRLKLKQILCNLINNATKFTSDGYISVRAVVKRNNMRKEIVDSGQSPGLKMLTRFFQGRERRNEDTYVDIDAFPGVEETQNEVEIEFEVDDTGKGIPLEKQSSIFEDYVQVKETNPGQDGTGLGLGIVQYLVRIMKGELRIIQKEPGERGTCFRFNIFVSLSENEVVNLTERVFSSGFQHFQFLSHKPEGSHIVLCIRGEERRKVLKKFIESLSIKVTIIHPRKDLLTQLARLKRRLSISRSSVSGSSGSLGSNSRHLRIKDEHKISFGIVVFVIDSNAASCCDEFKKAIANFKTAKPKNSCKIVWLEDQMGRQDKHERWYRESDFVIPKPFHGSRLARVLSLFALSTSQQGMNFVDSGTPKDLEMNDLGSPRAEPSFSHWSKVHKVVGTKPEKPLEGKRILLVEDVKVLWLVVSKHLNNLGAQVEICTNGKEAVDKVCNLLRIEKEGNSPKSAIYDYILMDCEMPVMNGYEATRLIRKEEQKYGVRVPIFALSGHSLQEEENKSIAAGMDFHLKKPLDVYKLLEVIKSFDNTVSLNFVNIFF